MAVSGTVQEDLTPRGDVQNLQWTSPVPHHQDQTSPTVNSLASSLPENSIEVVPFLPRIIRDWNSLSKDAVEATTVDTFEPRAFHRPVN